MCYTCGLKMTNEEQQENIQTYGIPIFYDFKTHTVSSRVTKVICKEEFEEHINSISPPSDDGNGNKDRGFLRSVK